MNFGNAYLLAYSTVQVSSKDLECYILEQFSYMHILTFLSVPCILSILVLLVLPERMVVTWPVR